MASSFDPQGAHQPFAGGLRDRNCGLSPYFAGRGLHRNSHRIPLESTADNGLVRDSRTGLDIPAALPIALVILTLAGFLTWQGYHWWIAFCDRAAMAMAGPWG